MSGEIDGDDDILLLKEVDPFGPPEGFLGIELDLLDEILRNSFPDGFEFLLIGEVIS